MAFVSGHALKLLNCVGSSQCLTSSGYHGHFHTWRNLTSRVITCRHSPHYIGTIRTYGNSRNQMPLSRSQVLNNSDSGKFKCAKGMRGAQHNSSLQIQCPRASLAINGGLHTSPVKSTMEDRQTKALTVWSNIRELRASPMPALTLGVSGLVPFIGVPAYMLLSSAYLPQLAFAHVAYGASILAFLGGVRWGFTIPEENPVQPDWRNLGYSVMPSLVAWVGLLLPYPASLFTMMGGLSVVAYFDMAMYGYPPWFKGLRFLLSFIAVLSLWTTFMCSMLLQTKEGYSEKIKEN